MAKTAKNKGKCHILEMEFRQKLMDPSFQQDFSIFSGRLKYQRLHLIITLKISHFQQRKKEKTMTLAEN